MLMTFLQFSTSCDGPIPEPDVISVAGVSLNPTSVELTEGDKITLTATINPDNATNKKISWKSSDNSVVTVSDGKLSALKVGNATITVTTEDGGKTATCQVTVLMKVIPVSSVSLDKTSVELTEGDETTLTATVNPDNATNKNVTWKSNDNSVATVSDGKITALNAGTTSITVTTEDSGKTATCEVKVNAKTVEPEVIPVSSVSLDKTSVELTEGDETTLTATVNPDNATNKNITWNSSDNSVATVVNGKVTALKAGTTIITVTTEDSGKTATCEVKVNAKTVEPEVIPVSSVSLDKTSVELTEGDETTLTATVNPDNATNKNITWNSSDNSVATVVNGKVTALKAGTTTITVTTEDGGKTATCEVTVVTKTVSVTSVSLDKTSVELIEGSEITVIATVNPDNATNKNVTWKSSNDSVATVSDGKITALKAGTATITVTTEDGGKTATCDIKVIKKNNDNDDNTVGTGGNEGVDFEDWN